MLLLSQTCRENVEPRGSQAASAASRSERRGLEAHHQSWCRRQTEPRHVFAVNVERQRFAKMRERLVQRPALRDYRDLETFGNVLSFTLERHGVDGRSLGWSLDAHICSCTASAGFSCVPTTCLVRLSASNRSVLRRTRRRKAASSRSTLRSGRPV